jgi:hypothetical protein
MRRLLVILLAWSAAAEIIDIKPQAWEERLPQSGAFNGYFSWVGAMRCEQPNEALVGVQLRRGTVVDSIAIRCAAVSCRSSNCTWSSFYTAATAGNQNGGQPEPWLMCKPGEMVSGFRAAVRNVALFYLNDVEFECAKITSSAVRVGRVFPVSSANRHWLESSGQLQAPLGGKLDPARECGKYGATGLGVAIGKYGLNRSNVVQTLGMYCGKPDQRDGCPPGSSSFPELSDVKGSSTCQPCVALHSSNDPITGTLDRQIANLPVARYNCHFYTLSYMNLNAAPGVRKRVPKLYDKDQVPGSNSEWETSGECLEESDFTNYGYRKVMAGTVDPTRLQPGDIIAVYRTSLISAGCRHTHSAIVIQTGSTVVIRQKITPAVCVTDLTWPEFKVIELDKMQEGGIGVKANVWRR